MAKHILFVCTENACRSQMAEGFFNSMNKGINAESAGLKPAKEINPKAVKGCPITPKEKTIDWNLEDPAGKPLKEFREVRDKIEQKVKKLISEVGE
jgi:arsenate reductase